jgi:dihydrofolate synthase/folylpolyglutamate synthase
VTLTYEQALVEVQRRGRFGVRLGLGRTRALLRGLGEPERSIRGALIGGTNGKGSVVALVGSVLREAGLRAGETPKPHLVTYRERLRIDGRLIDAAAFARLVEEALPVAERVARRHGEPTEFELLTALAFRWFADERVELALVEVGLGGRLDATHAWDGGVAAIVNVDLDHTAYLGPTVEAIAREKAAIVMRGDLAVTGATGGALAVVRRRARRVGVPLTVVGAAPLRGLDRDGIVVELPRLGETRVGMRGRHQAANVAVADAVLDALGAAGIAAVSDDARRRGFAAATWPGRLELVRAAAGGGTRHGGGASGTAGGGTRLGGGTGTAGPMDTADTDVLLDGAHNPAGAAVLADALDDLRPFLVGGADRPRPSPMTLLTAMMSDKDVRGVVEPLAAARSLAGGRVICTELAEPRALPAAALAAAWTAAGAPVTVLVEPDPRAALDLALREAPGPVVVAGSLYLVGAVRAVLVDDPQLLDLTDPPARQ